MTLRKGAAGLRNGVSEAVADDAVSQGHLANLVGASRPRVTERLARLERDGLVIRQGRQLVVCADELKDSISGRIPDLPIKITASKALMRAITEQEHLSKSSKPSICNFGPK